MIMRKSVLQRKRAVGYSLVAVWSMLFTSAVMAYDTIPAWTLTWTNAACTVGHLTCDADHGNWCLHVTKNGDAYSGYGLSVANSHLGAGSGVVSGAGELDLRGTITGPVTTGGAAVSTWKIAQLCSDVFQANTGAEKGAAATPARAITKLRTPGTLVGDNGLQSFFHTDGTPNRVLAKECIIIEPEVTGALPWYFLNGCSELAYLLIQCPKMTGCNAPVMNARSPDKPSSFSDWDLSSVTKVGSMAANATGAFNNWWTMPGVIRLPSLQCAGHRTFQNCTAMTGAVLGEKGMLEEIGDAVCSNCTALVDVVLGAAPEGKSLRLGGTAFAAANLKRVWFNGSAPPVLQPVAGAYTFGTASTAEGQITFYVRDTPAWAAVLAAADADPNRLVAADVFDTAQKQRVERFGGFIPKSAVTAEVFDPNFTSIYAEGVVCADASSAFPYATTNILVLPVTLTATNSGLADAKGRRSTFYRWDGVARELERTNPLVINSTADMRGGTIRAFFAHDWVYDASTLTNTIDNGVWKLNVEVRNAVKRELNVGMVGNKTAFSTAFTGVGTGKLDMNGTIRDDASVVWQIASLSPYAMTRLRAWDYNAGDTTASFPMLPTAVVYPETVLYNASSPFNFNQTRAWPLEEVICIAPVYTGNLHFNFNGATKLQKLLVRAPLVTTVQYFVFQDIVNATGDLDDWDLTGVTTIKDGTFKGKQAPKLTGTLYLPNLRTIGKNNFSNYTSIAGVTLGTNLTVTTIGDTAFYGATALKTVTVCNAKARKGGCTIGSGAFGGSCAPTAVTFLGPRNEALADGILTGVAETAGEKAAVIYASPAMDWPESAAALTAEEAAAAPDGTFGVYRAGLRKAYLVAIKSPFDPRGLTLILR